MSDTRQYTVWPDPRSRSRALQSWKSFCSATCIVLHTHGCSRHLHSKHAVPCMSSTCIWHSRGGVIPSEFRRDLLHHMIIKLQSLVYRTVLFWLLRSCVVVFSRFDRTPTCERQMGGPRDVRLQQIPVKKLAPYVTDGQHFTTDICANFKVTWHKKLVRISKIWPDQI